MEDGSKIVNPEDRAERRRRRREALGRKIDTTIPSPCISVCTLDPVTNWCMGCHRTIDEIRNWPILSAEEKQSILAAIEDRRSDASER